MATAASAQKRGGSAENDKSNHSAEMSTSTEAQRTGFILLVGKVQVFWEGNSNLDLSSISFDNSLLGK